MSGTEEAREKIRQADMEAAAVFEKRMAAVREVAEYKMKNGIPVYDEEQERKVFLRGASYIEDDVIRGYYLRLLEETVKISREYQQHIIDSGKKKGSD